jgi:hypothetical protein
MSKAKKVRSPKKRLTLWVAEVIAVAVARRVIRGVIRKL